MICQPCLETEKELTATSWCLDCQDPLCSDCRRHHTVLKATKTHKLIDIDEYQSIAQFLRNVSTKCKIHFDREMEYFCQYHDEPCCSECKRTKHKSCSSVDNMEDTVHAVKGSYLYEDLKKTLTTTLDNTAHLLDDVKQSRVNLDKDRNVIIDRVREVRKKLETHLHFLESTAAKRYDDLYEEEQKKLEKLETILCEKKINVEHSLKTMKDIIPKISNMQVYLSLKQMTNENCKEDDSLLSLDTVVSVSFHVSSDVLTFQNVSELCTFQVKRSKSQGISSVTPTEQAPSRPRRRNKSTEKISRTSRFDSDVKPTTDVKRQRNINMNSQTSRQQEALFHQTRMAHGSSKTLPSRLCSALMLPPRQFAAKTLPFRQDAAYILRTGKLSIPTPRGQIQIIDIEQLTEGEFVMTDNLSSRIIVYNEKNSTYTDYIVGDDPDSIAVISKTTIAVTQGQRNVVIFSLKNNSVIKTVDMTDAVGGLTIADKKIVVNCVNKGLTAIRFIGDIVATVPTVTGKLSLHGVTNRVICADQIHHKITCVTVDGSIIFSLKEQYINPTGITSDKKGNIYVASYGRDSIIKFDSDGSHIRQILSSEGQLKTPLAILYDKTDKILLVSNNDGGDVVKFKECIIR